MVFRHIVHVNGDAEDRGQGEVEVSDMAAREHAVVGPPVVHDLVSGTEGAAAGQPGCEPGGWPGRAGAQVECVVDFVRKFHGPSLRDLEHRPDAGGEIEADHGGGDAAERAVVRAPSTAREIFRDRRVPCRRLEAGVDFFVRDLPEGLEGGLSVRPLLLAGSIEGCRAGIDQVEQTIGRRSFRFPTPGSFGDGVGAPVGAEVGKDLGAVGQQPAEEHAGPVHGVVFRGHDVGGALPIPIEGTVEDRLEVIPIRVVVGPLPLALEAPGNGVVAVGLFTEAQFGQPGIAHHQVAGDEGHLDGVFPFLVQLFAAARFRRAVEVLSFRAVLLRPGQGLLVFHLVEQPLVDPSAEFAHIDGLDPHAEVIFQERGIDHAAGDAHARSSHGQIGFSADSGDSQSGPGEVQDFFLHIIRDGFGVGVLDVASVDAEGGESFLRVAREHGGEIDGARAFGAVESPDRLGPVGVHVHGFGSVAPAGGDRQADADIFPAEFVLAGGGFADAADGGVRDDTFDLLSRGGAEILAD